MRKRLCDECECEVPPACCTACPYPGEALLLAGSTDYADPQPTSPPASAACNASLQRPQFRFKLATSFWQRLRGLLGRKPSWLSENEVLVLSPCNSIHTWGMRHSIDVAFVDERGVVLKAQQAIPPRERLSCSGAKFALERFSSENAAGFPNGERVTNVGNWLFEGEITLLSAYQ